MQKLKAKGGEKRGSKLRGQISEGKTMGKTMGKIQRAKTENQNGGQKRVQNRRAKRGKYRWAETMPNTMGKTGLQFFHSKIY